MDAAEIARLRATIEKATPGPWRVSPWHVEEADETVRCAAGHAITSTPASADAAYIAAFDPPTTRALLDALEQARKERDRLARAICWDVPTNRVESFVDQVEDALKQERDRSARDKANAISGISRIEELLEIPEDERGFDYGTVNRAIEALTAQRDQAQQSAKDARALLKEASAYLLALGNDSRIIELRARIEAVLEQKP